jgi:hypothetical protein
MNSESSRMRFLIRLADRRGFLKGELNTLQEEALRWKLVEESEESYELEKERMKYTILAGNIHLWQELYKEDDDADVEWITPRSAEDLELVMKILDGVNEGREEFSD